MTIEQCYQGVVSKASSVRCINGYNGKLYTSRKRAERAVRQGYAEFVGDAIRYFDSYFEMIQRRELQAFSGPLETVRQVGNSGNRAHGVKDRIPSPTTTPEYQHWRESVLKRDNYQCLWCGATKQLQADHIKPRAVYPHLTYDVDNGRTLCAPCHRQTDTYGRKSGGVTSVTYIN